MQYKKHFMALTKNEIIFIGYAPKSKELSKTYQKEYNFNNIETIILNYENRQFTYQTTKINETKRTITDIYGNDYVETIRDEVPVEKIGNKDVFTYGVAFFKNVLVECVYFDIKKQKDSMYLAEKFAYKCKLLNVPYYFNKGGK